jgi:Protein of unknown function (DUF4013)
MSTAAPVPSGTVDFGRAFTCVTEDPDWIKKVLIGGAFTLLSSLLVGVPFVLGYFGRTLRNVVAGASRPLPEWDDLGGIFSEGLRLAAVYLVYVLGVGVVFGGLGCLLVTPAMLLGGARSAEFDPSRAVGAIGGLAMVALYGLFMLASLAMAVYLPAAIARASLRGAVREGFEWRAIVEFIKANLGNYLLSLVVYLAASLLAQFGVILCCVGIFPAMFWSYVVFANALGQTIRLNPSSLQ